MTRCRRLCLHRYVLMDIFLCVCLLTLFKKLALQDQCDDAWCLTRNGKVYVVILRWNSIKNEVTLQVGKAYYKAVKERRDEGGTSGDIDCCVVVGEYVYQMTCLDSRKEERQSCSVLFCLALDGIVLFCLKMVACVILGVSSSLGS